jgi:hypothetical protein
VAWLDGFQADLNPKPVIRSVGQIVISAMVKENAGFADGARLRDHFIPYFERKDTGLGPLRTRAAVPHKCFSKRGWEVFPVIIPMWYDRVAP